LSAPPPSRSRPAPFVKTTVPDPYEYRAAVRLALPPPEGDTPKSTTPRPPAK
jgi:hypothetical protein